MLKPPHEYTIREYLNIGRGPLLRAPTFIPEQVHGLRELRLGQVLGVKLYDAFEVPKRRLTNPKGIQFRKYINADVGVAVDLATEKPVGWISVTYPICIRQKAGIGSHLVAYFASEYTPPSG